MKILQINKFFFLKGGSERYLFDLSELLSQKGHRVLIWSTKHQRNFSFPNQDDFAQFSDLSKREGLVKDVRKVQRIFWNREARKKLTRTIVRERPDVAHIHNFFGHFSPSIISTLKKYGIPMVMTLHDYKIFCPSYNFYSQGSICFECLKNNNYRSCLNKRCVKDSYIRSLLGYLEGEWQKFLKVADKIDLFLAPSAYMKRKAVDWGIPSEKVVHLPNFVFPEKIDSSKPDPYFLYFGRLSKEKGVDLLVKSFIEISGRLPGWKLKIAGDGPEQERIAKLIENIPQVELLGIKRGKKLKETIAHAYAAVVPSVWPENFPYSVLESFALGKPVLAAKTGGLPELVKDLETGLLFKTGQADELKEKMIWAADNPKKMKQMGKQARQMVLNNCNPEVHYHKLIRQYQRILKY